MKRVLSTILLLLVGLTPAMGEPAPLSQPVARVAVAPPPPPPAEADALTLEDCYRLALKRSEQIAIHAELIKETEGRFLQAVSGALPRVSLVSTDLWQDGSGASAFTLRHRPERAFSFNQPLFSGFKEFAAMAGVRQERRQRQEEKARAEQLLLVDVANAFHLLLEQREDYAALDAIRVALVDRMDELRDRERLGRSRDSEVKSVETQLRRTEADLELARNKEEITRQLLGFLTGRESIGAVADPDAALPPPAEEATYLSKADGRADVQAAEAAWKAAEQEVVIARAKLWPTISAAGNYYVDRAGIAQDVTWDTTLTVNVPLFQGGQAVGSIKEGLSKARQARLHYVELQRSAELDIQEAYARLKAAITIGALVDQALAAAEESYRLQVQDYRLSLVNNLEVLQALQTLQGARRDDIHARRETKRLFWQLRAATGQTL